MCGVGIGEETGVTELAFLCVCPSAIKEISDLLNTGLDDETLRICVQLLEAGVNPEALATVVQELRRETEALKVWSLSANVHLGLGQELSVAPVCYPYQTNRCSLHGCKIAMSWLSQNSPSWMLYIS